MNETPFYISVAVMPVTTIVIALIGVLLNNSNMNSRLSSLEAAMNSRFGSIEGRMPRFEEKFDVLLDKVGELDVRANPG